VIEKPLAPPASIEDDFDAHYAPKAGDADAAAKPAE
jgi:ubiquinol-cytochrome c reductase cytochrome b subunit